MDYLTDILAYIKRPVYFTLILTKLKLTTYVELTSIIRTKLTYLLDESEERSIKADFLFYLRELTSLFQEVISK